ncbi:hypothetical protein [uncultured Shewanella sp.]|uniref:hypothetical protein n=1 Tax=uncultured Shewanella sp. TaxID=173975 RepID=UPI002611049E|nr:hypothetical protein [uncultured Shewanella sp.]
MYSKMKKNTREKGFVNKVVLKRSINSLTNIVQGRFYAPLPEQGTEWNTLLDNINTLHNAHALPNKADIDHFIGDSEAIWHGDEEHSGSVNRFNAFVTLKGKVKAGLEQLKLDPNDSSTLNWGDIIHYLTNQINAKGFITVNSNQGALGGGHGNGWFWNAIGVTTGSIPDSTHGQSAGALNGARGSVRTVIIAHNDAINAEKLNW